MDIKAQAVIYVTEDVVDAGRGCRVRYRRYEWVGPRWGLAWVCGRYLDDLHALPWPVQVIGFDWRRDRYLVARKDGACRLTAWWHDWRLKWRNRVAKTKARLVLTAAVWGLADVDDWGRTQWRPLFRGRRRARREADA